jgi:hypothetical protein
MSDPAIRDFVGIAENQWDFNDPNAIPGFCPLPATENVPAVLTQAALGMRDERAEMISDVLASVDRSLQLVTSGPIPIRVTARRLTVRHRTTMAFAVYPMMGARKIKRPRTTFR